MLRLVGRPRRAPFGLYILLACIMAAALAPANEVVGIEGFVGGVLGLEVTTVERLRWLCWRELHRCQERGKVDGVQSLRTRDRPDD